MKINQSIIAGALMRGTIRRKLETVKMHGLLDRWTEQKGFIDSQFFIYGIDDGVWESIVEWMEEVNKV